MGEIKDSKGLHEKAENLFRQEHKHRVFEMLTTLVLGIVATSWWFGSGAFQWNFSSKGIVSMVALITLIITVFMTVYLVVDVVRRNRAIKERDYAYFYADVVGFEVNGRLIRVKYELNGEVYFADEYASSQDVKKSACF